MTSHIENQTAVPLSCHVLLWENCLITFFVTLALPGHLSTADRGSRVPDHNEEKEK